MPVTYDGMELDAGYRLDLVVINFNARLFRDGVRRFAL